MLSKLFNFWGNDKPEVQYSKEYLEFKRLMEAYKQKNPEKYKQKEPEFLKRLETL